MTLGLAFWIVMLVWLVLGVMFHLGFGIGFAVAHTVVLFLLFVLVGWQVFGAPLRK